MDQFNVNQHVVTMERAKMGNRPSYKSSPRNVQTFLSSYTGAGNKPNF